MSDIPSIAVFQHGELSLVGVESNQAEAVLALPLSRLMVKVIRVPAENRENLIDYVRPILQAMSPYTDEQLTISCEETFACEAYAEVIAAALPEGSTDDLADALDAASLSVVRVDSLVFGRLRELWSSIIPSGAAGRRIVLLPDDGALAVFVLDGDRPSAIRSLAPNVDLRCEIMRVLLDAEDCAGAAELAEIVTVGSCPCDGLAAFAPIRCVEDAVSDGGQPGVKGVIERTQESGSFDAMPDSWREMLHETRFKKKLIRHFSIAAGIWLLIMLVLFGVPITYGFMTDRQKQLCREHKKSYDEVRDMRDKVRLVQKYSDHSRGALEILKAVSDRLPADVVLTSWNFKRGENVKFSGEADVAKSVYELKDALIATEAFASVELSGPSASKGKQKFDLTCLFQTEEE